MNAPGARSGRLTMAQVAQGRFTQVYLTANKHYGIVLYGVVFGSVLYVSFELAAGFPTVGALVPTSAVAVAALVAFFVGRRVLFFQPGGRA
jgi:hypothetical protein